jgi:ATP-binding cassette, subfamily B, bacterial
VIATLRRFAPFARPYRRALGLGAALSVLAVVVGLAKPWPLQLVVDRVLAPPGGESGLDVLGRHLSAETVLALATATVVLVVAISSAGDYWATRLMSGTGERIGNDIREALFSHLQRLSLRFHREHPVGDLSARLTSDVDRVQDSLVQVLSVFLPNALMVVGMVTVMVAVDLPFALLTLATLPLLALTVHRATMRMKAATRRARKWGGETSAMAAESLAGIQVLQAFTMEEESSRRFGRLSGSTLRAGLDAVRAEARFGPAVDLCGALATAAVLWFGAHRVLSGQLSLGVLLVFLTYLGSLYKPIRALSRLSYLLSRGAASGERIDAVLQETPDVGDRPDARDAGRLTGEIRFREVVCGYREEPVLHGIDLTVGTGEVVAVVGSTGSGKSTLLSLVPRFLDVSAGSVEIDGRDVRDWRLRSLRRNVSLVLQDTVLFRGTLWDNIAAGRPDATDEEIARVAREAHVDEFADRLPDGLETPIGERGADLSGGQRQRIAIARAMLRDAPILLLDEPTSALDAESEHLVLEALGRLTADRTTMVVAHRLSTVRLADRVVVLEGGRIVESGPPRDLIAAAGRYAELSGLQGSVGLPDGRRTVPDVLASAGRYAELSGLRANGKPPTGGRHAVPDLLGGRS